MEKVFIDSSIFIRLLTQDDEKKLKETLEFFKLIESGKMKSYTSNIVLLEIFYVLTKQYRFAIREVVFDLRKILQLRNLTLIEKTHTQKALSLVIKHNIRYGDCLIAFQIPSAVTLVTYDSDFSKIARFKSATPKEILASFKSKE